MRVQLSILAVLFTGAVASGWLAFGRGNSGGRAHLARVDRARADADLQKQVLPLLKQYCWDCHGDGTSKGDLALDGFTNVTQVIANKRTWDRILQNVRSGDMPPKKKKNQPSDSERQVVTTWIEHTLFPVDPEHPDPGRVTLRRMNRAEYNNTIRDLVGVDFKPANDFPQDDVGYGFDNIGDVLSLPPLLLEKYLRAAESVMEEAIVSGPRPPPSHKIDPQHLTGGNDFGNVRVMASAGEAYADVPLARPGRYAVRVKGYEQHAGPEFTRISIRFDGKEISQQEVQAKSETPGTYESTVEVSQAGMKRVAVAFLNDYYKERWIEKQHKDRPPTKEKVIDDRNFYCNSLEVVGPLGVEQPLPESHLRIFTRKPGPKNEGEVAGEIIGNFTKRAWRRPVEPAELKRLMTLFYEARAQTDNFEASVRHALTAVLVSPHFIYRNELQAEPNNPDAIHPVDEFALASRLSYFLWSSMPDDELFKIAGAGKLRKNLDAQVARMVQDPKARALTENFAGQWLQLRNLEFIEPDHEKFPAFNDDLRRDFRRETEQFFNYIVQTDQPVTDFLTADYTFANERLAKHYGLPAVAGDELRKVSLAGTPRQGLLSQGSILTLTSNPTRTSPVKRGKWVLENILATPPPPPPPGVPLLEAGEKLTGTLRQRMEKHRENAMCASCHSRMDPIGFAMEHFDGIGSWREKDGPDPVEPSGVLSSGEKITDHRDLNHILATSRNPDFLRCLSEKLLTYALGRGLEYYDKPAVDRMTQDLAKNGYRFSSLVKSVIHSVPFQYRRGDGDPSQVASAR
jgi:mono/diheme cytochrome c family protein